jgi:hypothetical protein
VRIVAATDSLAVPGGSETYLVTVVEHLVRLGHEVTVHAVTVGPLSGRAASVGARVARADELPDRPDGVLVQDVGMAYALAERWPGLPQVVVVHSPLFDFQLPPMVPVPGSVAVVLNDRVGQRVAAMAVASEIEVVRLRQPIDNVRLFPRGEAGPEPRRALLLGNYLTGGARRAITEAWQAEGVEVVQVGLLAKETLDPAVEIAEADIVVGKGRAVLDAMACGRPAFLYDAFGSDGWVTGATYERMEADGFAGQSDPVALDAVALRRALDQYDPDMGRVNRELVLKHHQDRKHAEALVGLLRRLSPAPAAAPTAAEELARLSRLRWHADAEAVALRRQVDELTGRALAAEARVADLERADRERQHRRAARRARRDSEAG